MIYYGYEVLDRRRRVCTELDGRGHLYYECSFVGCCNVQDTAMKSIPPAGFNGITLKPAIFFVIFHPIINSD